MLRPFIAPKVRRPLAIGLAALALSLGFAPTQAQAAPPNAQEFTLRYFQVNPDGSRGPQLVTRDFQTQFNAARCQCGDKVRVVLQRPRGDAWDAGIMEIRVGRMCDRGAQQAGIGNQSFRPCVLVERMVNPQGDFLKDVVFDVPVYWFASGLRNVNHEKLGEPETLPYQFCPELTGEAGVWMCFTQDSCQEGNFFFKPMAAPNPSNVPGSGQNNSVQKVETPMLDLLPPGSAPDLIPGVSPGDDSVELRWDLPSDANNVVGYRVLCRNKQDAAWRHPEGQKAIATFPGDFERFKTGTIYQLPQYLGVQCRPPEIGQPIPEGQANEEPGQVGATPLFWAQEPWQSTGTAGTATTGSSGTTTTPGTTTGGGTTTGSTGSSASTSTLTDSTGTDSSSDEPSLPPDEILGTKDWAYICSDHLPGSSRTARIGDLINGEDYIFQLVAYDMAGNSALIGRPVPGKPHKTIDYWDACNENNTNRCGKLGYCAVSTPGSVHPLWALGLLLLGLVRRKDSSCS